MADKIEGIVFGGYFLYENEFKELFKKYWNSDLKIEFITTIQNFVSKNLYKDNDVVCTTLSPKELYYQWETITNQVFGNASISLLGILYWDKQYHYTFVKKESDLLQKYVAENITISKTLMESYRKSMAYIQKTNVEQIMSHHFEQMKKSMKNTQLNKNEAYNFHKYLVVSKKSKYYKALQEAHMTGYNLYQIFYQRQVTAEGLMQDAFVNHLGKKHLDVLKILSQEKLTNQIPEQISINKKTSVFSEEKKWPFIQLLINSLNPIPYWTGGDAIVTNNMRQVLFNIQVKSGIGTNASWDIATQKLIEFLNTLNDILNKQSDDIANFLYKNLKTDISNSPDTTRIDQDIEDKILENIRKNLTKSK